MIQPHHQVDKSIVVPKRRSVAVRICAAGFNRLVDSARRKEPRGGTARSPVRRNSYVAERIKAAEKRRGLGRMLIYRINKEDRGQRDVAQGAEPELGQAQAESPIDPQCDFIDHQCQRRAASLAGMEWGRGTRALSAKARPDNPLARSSMGTGFICDETRGGRDVEQHHRRSSRRVRCHRRVVLLASEHGGLVVELRVRLDLSNPARPRTPAKRRSDAAVIKRDAARPHAARYPSVFDRSLRTWLRCLGRDRPGQPESQPLSRSQRRFERTSTSRLNSGSSWRRTSALATQGSCMFWSMKRRRPVAPLQVSEATGALSGRKFSARTRRDASR